jgi:hemoglobin
MSVTEPAAPETASADLPFKLIGEGSGVRRLVDRFYDLMDEELVYSELRALHAPDLTPMRESLTGFLIGWLGGPRHWFTAHPGKCMMSMHAQVPVNEHTARQWRDAMASALADTGVDLHLAAQMNAAFAKMSENMRQS